MKIWQRSLIASTIITLGMIGTVAPSLAQRSAGSMEGSFSRSTSPSPYTGGVYGSGNGDVITRGFKYNIIVYIVTAILLFASVGWITKCIIDSVQNRDKVD